MNNLREAAQMALDCIVSNQVPAAEVKEALRAALAQPKPEPVAWAIYTIPPSDRPIQITTDAEMIDEISNPIRPLYTAPLQRKWQGLTDEEIHNTDGYEEVRKFYRFARAIEARLKEKNT